LAQIAQKYRKGQHSYLPFPWNCVTDWLVHGSTIAIHRAKAAL